MLMCIQNLVKFCPLVLKILSGNEMVTELRNNGIRNNGITEGQGKSNIAPLFQSGAIKNIAKSEQSSHTPSGSHQRPYHFNWKEGKIDK